MRGDLAVVKDVSGCALVRRVWDRTASAVFIHSEDEWQKRIRGERSLDPVGFPVEDVFALDDKARSAIENPCSVNWLGLTPYC